MTEELVFKNSLDAAQFAKMLANKLAGQAGASEFDPSFRKRLQDVMRDAVGVTDAAEDMRVQLELVRLIHDETERVESELAKQLDTNNLMVRGNTVVPRPQNLMDAPKATNAQPAAPSQPPIHITLPQQPAPVINGLFALNWGA